MEGRPLLELPVNGHFFLIKQDLATLWGVLMMYDS